MSHGPKSKKRKIARKRVATFNAQQLGFYGAAHLVATFDRLSDGRKFDCTPAAISAIRAGY